MPKRISSLMNRIKSFLVAIAAGIIFIVSGITDTPVFGQSYIEFILSHTNFDLGTQLALSNILNIMMLIANFTGAAIIIAGFLILFKRIRIARIILFIVMAAGLYGFIIPIFVSIAGGLSSLSIAVDAVASRYAVAVLLTLLAKLYADKAKIV
ncbi:MAG: hypothetical protein ACTSPY_00155 [Candidatus Helarchaeota archaeon]